MRSVGRRLLIPVGVSAVVLVAAGRAIGAPDWQGAQDFLLGSFPTQAGAVAAAQIAVWTAVGLLLAANLLVAASDLRAGALTLLRHRRQRGLAVLAAGVLLLGIGLTRHLQGGYQMCCGGVDEARGVGRLVK